MELLKQLEKYAALIAKVGINVQPGDTVALRVAADQVELTHCLVAACYDLGAAEVDIAYNDDLVTRLNLEHEEFDRLKDFPPHRKAQFQYWLDKNAKMISVISSDPDNLNGIDHKRISTYQEAGNVAMNAVRQATQASKNSWIVVAAASPAWAKLVFPNDDADTATQKLWEEIFKTTRVDQEDPIKAWEIHAKNLQERADLLNKTQYKELHYTAPGTDLTIGLPENHVWLGGYNMSSDGRPFMPNMPTEEVFTAANSANINGYVTSTKPLSHAGVTILDIKLTFKDGKVVEGTASQGNDVLQTILKTDEGAKSLGEVALVPDPSPISQSGLVFYNTLFDENASNHLALGSAYAFSIEGGTQMSEDELAKAGLNRSKTHVDFMIGSSQMNIDGITKDGQVEPVFRNGDWA